MKTFMLKCYIVYTIKMNMFWEWLYSKFKK